MQKKKILFLFLALIFPVLVFVFLKFFGRNEFEVPVLHKDSVGVNNCGVKYATPYLLPDSIAELVFSVGNAQLYLLNFSSDEAVLKRLGEELNTNDLKLINPSVNLSSLKDQEFIRRCVLLVPEGHDMVLIDSLKQIRGYYNSQNLDEVDRLIMEVKIILKQY
jgi:hypothetical protein